MQRDLKIGLSLAVLLLGVVGALFFRKDDVELADYPELQNQEQLNRQIAEKARAPYLDDAASITTSQNKRVRNATRPGIAPQAIEEQSPVIGIEGGARSAPRQFPVTSEGDKPGIPADEETETVVAPIVTKPARSQPASKSRPNIPANDAEPSPSRPARPVESARKVVTDRIPPAKQAPQSAPKKSSAPVDDSVTATPVSAPQGIEDLTSEPETEQTPASEKQDRSAARRPMLNPTTAHKENLPKMFIPPTRVPPFAMPAPVTPRRTPRIVEEETEEGIDKDAGPGQQKVYRIRPRDTLERIAEREYGDRRKATQIYEANKDSLESPDQLREGKDLVLP